MNKVVSWVSDFIKDTIISWLKIFPVLLPFGFYDSKHNVIFWVSVFNAILYVNMTAGQVNINEAQRPYLPEEYLREVDGDNLAKKIISWVSYILGLGLLILFQTLNYFDR